MLFLSEAEKKQWRGLGDELLKKPAAPGAFDAQIRPNLRPVFHFFGGALLASQGQEGRAMEWFQVGAKAEDELLFFAEYHMLRTQWHQLCREALGPAFTCRSDAVCYADEYVDLFSLHYGK